MFSDEDRTAARRAFMNKLPSGVMIHRPDERFTIEEVNDEFLRILGYAPGEELLVQGASFLEMVHPGDRAAIECRVFEQLCAGPVADGEFRVVCKGGTVKWVMARGRLGADPAGRELLFCTLMDITEQMNTREALRLSLERHQIIMDQTTDIIFEWDFASDAMLYSANWQKKFGYEPIDESVSTDLPAKSHIHPEDVGALKKVMADARRGAPYSTAEVRIRNAQGRHIWCRIRATDQYDEAGAPIKAVGVVTDIDEEKRMIEGLRHRAERDALTGLYNKDETRIQIERYLSVCEHSEISALLMVDVDDFKVVNDSKGHLFGDAALTALAAAMKRLARSTDVIGRIGGDEFAVFLKAIPSEAFALQKAQQLLSAFHQLFAGEKQAYDVSCSIGVALSPADGRAFQQLFRCADAALYQAKSEGKNRIARYEGASDVGYVGRTGSALGAEIDSDRELPGDSEELIHYVFQVLYRTDDIEEAVPLIMEIAGKRYDVSRVYIFENTEDGQLTNNTFEWCNAGVQPEKQRLQNIPYAQMDDYEAHFNEEGIFYCRDIQQLPDSQRQLLESQAVRSVLQCAIRESGQFKGFVGFDECTGLRLWTRKEIAALTLISRLLSTFLLKKRAQDRDRAASLRMRDILDSQDAFIYAIDHRSYELLYLNKKTHDLDPRARAGMKCHQAFFGHAEPCAHCPVREAMAKGSGSNEFYNPQYGIWTEAHASRLRWDDRDAYLIACYDITPYKTASRQ